jgi:hypothetical protein
VEEEEMEEGVVVVERRISLDKRLDISRCDVEDA